jgi:hypothetical protein
MNIELLKDACAIIGGIPEEVFELGSILREHKSDAGCSTIACAAGWLSLHPTFAAELKPKVVVADGGLRVEWFDPNGHPFRDFGTAMSALFDLSYWQAWDLFATRGESLLDEELETPDITDKQLWLARAHKVLQS